MEYKAPNLAGCQQAVTGAVIQVRCAERLVMEGWRLKSEVVGSLRR